MNQHATIEQRVARHYAHPGLERKILDALVATGKDVDQLVPGDLAPVDEFHTGGREATIEFARRIKFEPGTHLLDVGCGIGGTSRFFAEQYRCRVTGIDLTEDFVRTAAALARRVGLSERVSYRQASALALPFAAGTFGGAYMMHVGMNIKDKSTLFAEIRRVLKDEAAFGVYDVTWTGKGEVTYPLTCALSSDTAFIVPAGEYRRSLEGAGFVIEDERDRLEAARDFFRREMARAEANGGPSPLGTHLLLKEDGRDIFANVFAQYDAGVLAPVEFICRAR